MGEGYCLYKPNYFRVMNNDLCATIDKEEVKKAVFQMHPDKAPRPDDFNPCFYQRYWDIVEEDVVSLVRKFFFRMVSFLPTWPRLI